jgi:peptidoglycan hydrolase-like protein with peptidoglycan-binding domain
VIGDENEIVEAFQFLANCFESDDFLVVDGDFGPATKAGVRAMQSSLGLEVDGEIDEDLMRGLSRGCSESRRLAGGGNVTMVGNAAADDPEVFTVGLLGGASLSVTQLEGDALTFTLTGADGTVVDPLEDGSWEAPSSQDYLLSVAPEGEDPVTFTIRVGLTAAAEGDGWIMGTDRITNGDITLEIGDDAETVIDSIFDTLGHGVRGRYAEFDTDWYADPGNIGLRGIFIEGMAFLFYGPSPDYPDQAETLARIRYEGPGYDAADEPRPANYVTTEEGITVGNTLAQLKAAYGSGVRSGSNAEEHYYRLADSRGELCFYFGGSEPDDSSVIVEMATECRS